MRVISFFHNEPRLIKEAAKNNRSAQRHLYEMFCGKMLSVCRMYIKDLHYAEDVMLSGFVKVFDNLDSYRGEGSFEGWIRRIMIRESVSFLRKNKNVVFYEEAEPEPGDIKEDPVSSEEDVEHIQALIDNLPEGYRMVFIMHAIEGYKHEEIAGMLEITVGTSKSQLFKARKILQEKLQISNTKANGASNRRTF